MPEAKQGILDLRDWDLEEKGIINFNGEWEFYWEKLLEPEDFAVERIPEMSGFIEVHRIWNGYEVKNEAGTGKRSEVDFSHGLCPDCAEKLYFELQYDKKESDG